MAKPHYVDALEHFKSRTDDPLIAYVAFALYIDAECKWAEDQTNWPTPAAYRNYYDCNIPHNGKTYTDNADEVLLEFATDLVQQERHKFVAAATAQFNAAVRASHPGFWRGVWEAVLGAAIWSLILVIAAIVATRLGVDVFEAFHKAAINQPPHL